MNCELCQKPLPKSVQRNWGTDSFRCPSCFHWNLEKSNSGVDDDETVLLSDARLLEIERIMTGLLDTVFGGGIARSSVNLIAGPPGAGKTTLFLQLADTITERYPDREGLYIANEQEAAEIKTTAKRIRIKNLERIRVVKAMGGLKRDLGELLLQYKPCVIIVDSLTKLVGEDIQLAVLVLERLKSYTVELNAPSLVVNQINKDGDHAGLMKLQHAVDGTFMLEKDDLDGSRYFYSSKNRFGEAPLGVELVMTASDAEIPGKLVSKAEDVSDGKEEGES
jgi:DNA repair protein RadA/Sms